MLQNVLDHFRLYLSFPQLFVIPFLAGAFFRFLFRRRPRGWVVTLIAALLTLAAIFIEKTVPPYGSELFGILTAIAVSLLIGTLLMEIVTRIRRRK